ncbi:MAG TPA: SxtJ family membrane protein [Chthoniobacterales bacterium]|nr:SxtJ family membrane protein [Chthoniobacterales bacterium]
MSWISDEYRKLDRSPRALRRFGFTVGMVALFVGSILWWRHRGAGLPLILFGAALIHAAGFAPFTLNYVHGPWMIVALALGWVVTRILLTIVFFFVVAPIGLLQRLFGKRTIEVAFATDASSYWQSRTNRPVPSDYEKQF